MNSKRGPSSSKRVQSKGAESRRGPRGRSRAQSRKADSRRAESRTKRTESRRGPRGKMVSLFCSDLCIFLSVLFIPPAPQG